MDARHAGNLMHYSNIRRQMMGGQERGGPDALSASTWMSTDATGNEFHFPATAVRCCGGILCLLPRRVSAKVMQILGTFLLDVCVREAVDP